MEIKYTINSSFDIGFIDRHWLHYHILKTSTLRLGSRTVLCLLHTSAFVVISIKGSLWLRILFFLIQYLKTNRPPSQLRSENENIVGLYNGNPPRLKKVCYDNDWHSDKFQKGEGPDPETCQNILSVDFALQSLSPPIRVVSSPSHDTPFLQMSKVMREGGKGVRFRTLKSGGCERQNNFELLSSLKSMNTRWIVRVLQLKYSL